LLYDLDDADSRTSDAYSEKGCRADDEPPGDTVSQGYGASNSRGGHRGCGLRGGCGSKRAEY